MAEEDAAPLPSARSAVPGSPLRLYVAHFLVLEEGEEGEGEEGRAPLHQYLYEHPNGLFIVGLGASPDRLIEGWMGGWMGGWTGGLPPPHPLSLHTPHTHQT